MKRLAAVSLLSLAPWAASSALAQSSPSNVTLYGILDAGVEYTNDDANVTANAQGVAQPAEATMRLRNGGHQGSRFGVRGVEDLGGGLRAVFALEHRLNVDTGAQSDANSFWNGQAWVGLQGGWGRLTAGRQYVPMYAALAPIDATLVYGFYNNLSTLFNNRLDNSVEYRTPAFAGFTGSAMYAFGENATPGQNSRDSWGVAAWWSQGPFFASAAWTSYGQTTGSDREEWSVAAAWKPIAGAQIGAGYLLSNRLTGRDIENIFVSGSIGVGTGSLFLNYVRQTIDGGTDNDRFGLAYSLPLSKRTNVYVATGLEQDVTVGARLVDPLRVAVGVRHLF